VFDHSYVAIEVLMWRSVSTELDDCTGLVWEIPLLRRAAAAFERSPEDPLQVRVFDVCSASTKPLYSPRTEPPHSAAEKMRGEGALLSKLHSSPVRLGRGGPRNEAKAFIAHSTPR
jgi:hypothetical protein